MTEEVRAIDNHNEGHLLSTSTSNMEAHQPLQQPVSPATAQAVIDTAATAIAAVNTRGKDPGATTTTTDEATAMIIAEAPLEASSNTTSTADADAAAAEGVGDGDHHHLHHEEGGVLDSAAQDAAIEIVDAGSGAASAAAAAAETEQQHQHNMDVVMTATTIGGSGGGEQGGSAAAASAVLGEIAADDSTQEQEQQQPPPAKKAKRLCRHPGCTRVIKSQGHCQRHGARAKRCRVGTCDKQAQGTHDGMCKRHWKATHFPNSVGCSGKKKKAQKLPPAPEGDSVYDNVLPQSIAYRPGAVKATAAAEQDSEAAAAAAAAGGGVDDSTSTDPCCSSSQQQQQQHVMPLVAFLRSGSATQQPAGWHRNSERRARGLFPVTPSSLSQQLEPWERQLVTY